MRLDRRSTFVRRVIASQLSFPLAVSNASRVITGDFHEALSETLRVNRHPIREACGILPPNDFLLLTGWFPSSVADRTSGV